MAAYKECVTAWTFKELGIAKVDPAEIGIPKPEEFDKWWPPKDYTTQTDITGRMHGRIGSPLTSALALR